MKSPIESPVLSTKMPSLSWLDFTANLQVSDPIKAILIRHLEEFTIPKVNEMIDGWDCGKDKKSDESEERVRLFNRTSLLTSFYIAANESHEYCCEYLDKTYQHTGNSPVEDDEDLDDARLSARIFSAISKHCSGSISRAKEGERGCDPIWHECNKERSNESDDKIAAQIGVFFRTCLDKKLRMEFNDLYEEVASKFSPKSSITPTCSNPSSFDRNEDRSGSTSSEDAELKLLNHERQSNSALR